MNLKVKKDEAGFRQVKAVVRSGLSGPHSRSAPRARGVIK